MRLLFGMADRLLTIALLVLVVAFVVGRDNVAAAAGGVLDELRDSGRLPAAVVELLPPSDQACTVKAAVIAGGARGQYGFAALAGETVTLSLELAQPPDGPAPALDVALGFPLGGIVRDYGRLAAVEALSVVLAETGGYTVLLDNAHAEAAVTATLTICFPS